MLFSSSVFLFLFLPITLCIYYNPWTRNKRCNREFRNIFLLLASLFFYAWGEPVFVFLMLFSIIINWIISLQMEKEKAHKKVWLICSVVVNIGIIFYFKYLTFVLKNINYLVGGKWSIPEIALPIGISFFTFQILSYIFDVYYGKVGAQKKLYKFALYVAMFPQLIAGPIVRYSQIAEEIDSRQENRMDFNDGIIRFCWGLGKKVIFSNYMGMIADNMFYLSKQSEISVVAAWIGAFAYTAQIYYDFSGYSDMAIGLGKAFGFHFQENFNYPYISKSITEFWKRWHISLSSWFRDYVYIPLGGSRVSAVKVFWNTFLVWLLTGIWHGANWTFIVWGLGYFCLLMIERKLKLTDGIKGFGHIYTIFWVNLLWVIFRADNFALALKYISEMFGKSGVILGSEAVEAINGSWQLFVAACIFTLPISRWIADKLRLTEQCRKNIRSILALPIFILCVAKCVVSAYNPFIYFNF